jgi:hypothetical protein
MYQGASTIMDKISDWKHYRDCMFEVEAVPQSYIPYLQIGLSMALYMRIWLHVQCFDFRPSNECIW